MKAQTLTKRTIVPHEEQVDIMKQASSKGNAFLLQTKNQVTIVSYK